MVEEIIYKEECEHSNREGTTVLILYLFSQTLLIILKMYFTTQISWWVIFSPSIFLFFLDLSIIIFLSKVYKENLR